MVTGCLQGKVKGVVDTYWVGDWHQEGHQRGDALKQVAPAKFNSLAFLFKDVSPLAGVSRDEAFAEGYVVAMFDPHDLNGQILMRSVSRLQDADPDTGAPDLLGREAVEFADS